MSREEKKRMEKRMKQVINLFWIAALSLLSTSCSGILADLGLAEDPASSVAGVDGECDPDESDECEGASTARRYADEDDESGERDNFRREPVGGGGTRNRVLAAIEANDVVPGMTRAEVLQSWGEPHVREFAGSGESGHERWTYGSQRSVRGETYLIFEDGRVVGW